MPTSECRSAAPPHQPATSPSRVPANAVAAPADGVLERLGDLDGEPLLDLQPAGEDVHQARDLREADHLVLRDVSDVGFAKKWEKMMLTVMGQGSTDQERGIGLAFEGVDG